MEADDAQPRGRSVVCDRFHDAAAICSPTSIQPTLWAGSALADAFGLFSRPQHTVIMEDDEWVMSLNKGIPSNRHYDYPGKGKFAIASRPEPEAETLLMEAWYPSTCKRFIASEDTIRRRVEFRAYFQRGAWRVLKTRLAGASWMFGKDLEHALAIHTQPQSTSSSNCRTCNVSRWTCSTVRPIALVDLSQQLDSLVPEDDSLSDHDRKAELQAFVDDWIAQQRHRALQTAIDGRGRIPSEAVYPTPVFNDAFKGLLSLPAGPVQLKHELRLAAEARVETLARVEPPAWWRWVMRAVLVCCAVALLVISWSVVVPAGATLRHATSTRGGKRNVFLPR